MRIRDNLLVLSTILCLLAPSTVDAATPRVFPEGKRPDDSRLESQKDLNGYFPFLVPKTREAWEVRKRELKQRILVSTGLWPMPQRTPLKPVIFGKTTRPGFTVEKVHFESVPGHFVTGLLFRPAGKKAEGKHPAVLCPHGHGGRLQDYGVASMAALIKSGAEKFSKSGRFPKLARCATLARMGCVTFIFDMEGYADAQQIGMAVAHRLRTQRAHMNSPDGWGFISTQAELRLQSIMGLQTWNSIRGLDFLAGLPDVDPKRIGVTGGSGGGILTAWVVGKTQRFRAAVAQKPVINWYSFVGATDIYTFVSRYWFGSLPWEDPKAYRERSPLSLVGKVTTPTMLMTGEEDYRTPISESEQFYHALKLRRIDTMLVRIPGAGHAIVKRPSRLMVKVAHILKWFETYAKDTGPGS